MFEDGFTLEDCQHDDETPFDAGEEDPDDHDLDIIKQNRAAAQGMDENGADNKAGQDENAGDEEEPEIESDDLMLYIDEALNKIISRLPSEKKKTELN